MKYKYRIVTHTCRNGTKIYHAQVARDSIAWWPNALRCWGSLSEYGTRFSHITSPLDTREEALIAIERHKKQIVEVTGNEIISTEVEYV